MAFHLGRLFSSGPGSSVRKHHPDAGEVRPHSTAAGTTGSARWFWLFVAGCLLIQTVLAVDCARQWTPTHDEYWHLPIGLRMWKSGRFDDDVINPPPVRLWAAIPLVLGGADPGDVNARLDVGDIGDAFWQANGPGARLWFLLGRLMIVPLLALTGVAIAAWGRAWYGHSAGMTGVLLWACCPTALANGVIVTHDLPLAAAWTLTLWTLVRFAELPTWPRAVLFGVTLGLAPLAKLTGLLLVPLCILLWFVLTVGRRPATGGAPDAAGTTHVMGRLSAFSLRHGLAWWGLALGIALAVINAGYLFQGTGATIGSLKPASSQLQWLQRSVAGLHGVPVPLPGDFLAALDRLALDLERRHPVYLDGEWSDRPFARYYAAALCYKLPISTLALALVGLAGLVWPQPGSADRRHGAALLIGAFTLPLLASGSSNQIGIRYVLPALPLLCIYAGQSARFLGGEGTSQRGRWLSRLVWVMVLAAPLSLRFHPHHLAYFNLAAGGPMGGRWHLVDSNLDWGQDLHALKLYLDRHHVQEVGLAYFGTVAPATIGIRSHHPPSRFPQPGWYAISVNFVQGRPHAIRDSQGNRMQVGIEEFGYFRFFQPVATIGYSIDVYRLTQRDVDLYAMALRDLQQGR